jgi:hypothetical protein
VHVAAIESSTTSTIPEQAMLHFRLGHLSTNRLSILHSKLPYSSISVDHKGICDVCHLAKHMRPPFQNSFNKVTISYEMLHLDIWGPLYPLNLFMAILIF